MKTHLSPRALQRLLSATALVGFFVLWEIVCIGFGVSDLILPRPSQVALVLWQRMPLLWSHTEAARALYNLHTARIRKRFGAPGVAAYNISRFVRIRFLGRRFS